MTTLEKAEMELNKAKAAARATACKAQAAQIDGRSKAKAAELKANGEATLKANETLEGNVGDSKRKKVIVERKYSEQKHKIFASTVITKNGKPVLEQFRIPVDVEVELPVEIIEHLKQRKIAKQMENKQIMVPEFIVELV